ncbi:cupin domain-containing protein [Parafrigoribacterium mesophilum]|uniref:cupin domain-containing protein n=1 Tax=Parafrigoribacterium mesophilum TaxID=433646 RepID=UPI0031FDC506
MPDDTEAAAPLPAASIILHPATLPALDRGSGVSTVPLVTGGRGAATFLSGVTSFQPGAALPLHRHNCLESVVILAGEAVVDIAGVETALVAGDTTIVPAEVPHRFRNASGSQRMRILWIYGSIDATRTILATGVTTRIDTEQAALR